MFWAGYSLAQIVEVVSSEGEALVYATVASWKKREKWESASSLQKIEGHLEARYYLLMAKENKTDADLKEMDAIGKEVERAAKIRRYEASGNGSDLNPRLSKRRKGKKLDSAKKNYLSEEQCQAINDAFLKDMFDYQKVWHGAKQFDVRNILKSRQIGATFYFAHEAIVDAINTGDNQIFLSASKAQAHVFKNYILDFVYDVTGVELKGDPIKLWNGATLYFLGTNSKTAQSYHGHLYFDEYFWTHGFAELQKVASGMAMQEKYRETYFSTPSTTTHDGYVFWNGKHFNKGRPKKEHIAIDISHEALAAGVLCDDGQWRQMVTIEDALAGGCNLFNLEKLRKKYSKQDYDNLLMCQFIDDQLSIFSLRELQYCYVDSWVKWSDFKPLLVRPLGNREVWVGYDPSRTTDDSSLVVVAPPIVPGGAYRIIERLSFNGMNFADQAAQIKAITKKYNVTYIGIDVTGMGRAVYELVTSFYPAAVDITYSVEVKNRLVLKLKQVINDRKLEYDAGWVDITLSLLTVSKDVTPSGKSVSYQTSRTAETGHGDVAWALMNAIDRREFALTDDSDDQSVKTQMMSIF